MAEGEIVAEQAPEPPVRLSETRLTWRGGAQWLLMTLRPIAPALILLWLPCVVASAGRLPGSEGLGHTALSIPALMAGGLAPLWVAVGWAKLRGRSITGMYRLLKEHGWLGGRLVRFLVLAPTLTVFFGSLASWKSVIPMFYPGFVWDAPLERAEVWLHGGHPDRLLAPLFGAPGTILFLDRVYHTWFYMLFGLVIWQAWESDQRRLHQFWTSFALVWVVLGIFAATWFASAGPIFAALDRHAASYNDLIARLKAAEALAPLFVHMSAWSLWEAARQPGVSLGDGISAFPSLHVATVALGTLAMWRVNRLLGGASAAYALLILLGSIMLGWHYALDGEVAILATAAVWVATGRWMGVAWSRGPGETRICRGSARGQ